MNRRGRPPRVGDKLWRRRLTLLLAVVCCGACQRSDEAGLPAAANASPEARGLHAHLLPEPLPAADVQSGIADSEGWPCFLGPHRNGAAASPPFAPGSPRERWRRQVGEGYSAPVLLAERLILLHRLDAEEVIECFDADSGARLWQFRYATTYRCPVAYSSGPYSTAALDRGRVYAVGAQGQVHCLDLATGALCWRRLLHEEYDVRPEGNYPVAASPLLDEDRLIVQVGGRPRAAGVVALDARSGKTLWTAGRWEANCATPVAATIQGRRWLVVWSRDELAIVCPATGRVTWTARFAANHPDTVNATTPLLVGDCVLVSGYSVGALCVQVLPDGTGRERWRGRNILESQYPNLVHERGLVYGLHAPDATLRCIELATGRVVWRQRTRLGRGAWCLASGADLLCWGERGTLAAAAMGAAPPVIRFLSERPLLPSPCYPAPAFWRGRLYLRANGELACFDLAECGDGSGPLDSVAEN